jgi:hypothetical protein
MAMAYQLCAMAGRQPVIQAAGAATGVRAVELRQGIWLLPITRPLWAGGDTAGAVPFGQNFYLLSAEIEAIACQASRAGLVAYLEAEIFGGAGDQAAVAWRDGEVCLGPFTTQGWAQEPSNRVQWPLNRALRELGVARGEAFDEFDAVGLGKHRHTEDWLKAD